jgi:hypothetical protein
MADETEKRTSGMLEYRAGRDDARKVRVWDVVVGAIYLLFALILVFGMIRFMRIALGRPNLKPLSVLVVAGMGFMAAMAFIAFVARISRRGWWGKGFGKGGGGGRVGG